MVNKNKYNDHIQERGLWAPLPNELWERTDIDAYAKVIWAYIVSRNATWSSSRNNISRNLGIDKETVTERINTLKERNMIKVTVGTGKSWSFEIIPPNQWVG